ncbi:phospholipase A(1) LCAT3 isoform X2 [Syzygium oleosum]|uniref:phospholipase A(1) LCAT3 isoform X2 n=1 Tax=Syzygium oleosum TaxID=219896 RepID=UPI0024B940C2|nr:phospholipase A(1) LCAT3 isoform X2 [Syzygium oleosum]
MWRDRVCPCFWFGNGSRHDHEASEERNPVLLVSGMGGSILHSKKKEDNWLGFDTRVWVRILLADLEFKNKLWSLFNPSTGLSESLDDDVEIVVPDDDYGLYAIDILDPSWFVKLMHLKEVYHFHDMIDMLVGIGYKKGTTLFGYGYDFRQSNRANKLLEGLQSKLETAYKASGGAPGCVNDSLLTGLQFVEGFESYFFVSRWTMHQLLIECPSIYEMMANPEFEWANQPKIEVWQKHSIDGDVSVNLETYGPLESVPLFESALRNNELNYQGRTIPLPFNLSILKWTAETRRIINDIKLPSEVEFYNIYGTSLDTPFDVCYGSEESPIEDLSEICHTLPEYSYVDGDGTVPAESARADGLKAVERAGVAAGHRQLLRDPTVFQLIQKWLGYEQVSYPKRVRTSRVMDSS